MSKLLFFINSLFGVALLFAYISPFIDPHFGGFFALFGLFYPLLLLINLFFVVYWAFIEPKYTLLSILLIAFGYGALTRLVNIHGQNESAYTLVSYNVGETRRLFAKNNKERFQHIRDFQKFFKDLNADIICLQERLGFPEETLEPAFLDYHSTKDASLGTVIYTRFPIVDSGNIPFETKAHNATWAELAIAGDTVRVYALHLSSNRITKHTREIMDQPDIRNVKVWSDMKFVLNKYTEHARKRTVQMNEILKHVQSSRHPVILCGDFNDVTQSYIYKLTTKRFKDAFTEAGTGIMKTYRSAIPTLRIDYAFFDNDFKIGRHEVLDKNFSDHYPVLTTFDLMN